MELTTRLAASLTHKLRTLRGTRGSFTLSFGEVFVQAASFMGNGVLVEVTGDQFLPADRRPTAAQQDELLRLGFNRPKAEMPNWWIGVHDGPERALYGAARAAVRALIEIHGVTAEALAEEVPVSWVSPYPPKTLQPSPAPSTGEGEPLRVRTTYGEVRLYQNGFASLNGKPWSDRPVREWQRLQDGRLSIELAIPGRDHFPHAGFVADTPEHAAVLRHFLPSEQEHDGLALRLAVTEHYALTCIATGTQYHDHLVEAAQDLDNAEGAPKASKIVGWEHAQRLAAATAAVSAFWWTRSADNNQELRSDQEDTWRAIQTWVRLSPWKDNFDFEIMPTPPPPFEPTGREVEIQRIYWK